MDCTVSGEQTSHPNRTTVRRIQPSMDGGRPTDPVTLGFEGSFQGLVVTKDDAKLDRDWVSMLRLVQSREQQLVRQLFAGRSMRAVELEIRACHRMTEKLIDRIDAREKRLGVVEIDQQLICSTLDDELTQRTESRR